MLAVQPDDGDTIVYVVPITSRPPARKTDVIELPPATCRRLNLPDKRCWIVLTGIESIYLARPRSEARPAPSDAFYRYGLLPAKLFIKLRDEIVTRARRRKLTTVRRTE